MLRNILTISLCSFFLLSCQRYKELPVAAGYISTLNKNIAIQEKDGASWTNAPEDIARQFFPPVATGSSRLYEIIKHIKSPGECIVTVKEEGAINDGVSGERREIYFSDVNGIWTITDLKHEVKSR